MATLLTWNVAGRVTGLERQLEALAERDDDVLCLQEVTPTTAPRWVQALEDAGRHVAVSAWPPGAAGSRRLAVLVASRGPVRALPGPEVPWPERVLAARTTLAGQEVEVHVVHAPLSTKAEQVKVRTLEAVHAALLAPCPVPRILAGDLNTPQYESREGEVRSFARTRTGRLRPAFGERHDRAELALVTGLPAAGWADAFRAVHGYARRDRSWVAARRGYGFRLDHVLVEPPLEPVTCDYVHAWREAGLSDHAALWVSLRVGG